MDDGPVPRSNKGHKFVRNFITSTLLKVAKATKAQKQDVPESISDDNPKTTIVKEAKSFVASSFEKDFTYFSNDNCLFARYGVKPSGMQFRIKFSNLKKISYFFEVLAYACLIYAEMMKVRLLKASLY